MVYICGLVNYISYWLTTRGFVKTYTNELSSPRKVPQKKGAIRTPTIGEARLMNQLGRNGMILRNIMYLSMSLW